MKDVPIKSLNNGIKCSQNQVDCCFIACIQRIYSNSNKNEQIKGYFYLLKAAQITCSLLLTFRVFFLYNIFLFREDWESLNLELTFSFASRNSSLSIHYYSFTSVIIEMNFCKNIPLKSVFRIHDLILERRCLYLEPLSSKRQLPRLCFFAIII